MSFFDSNVAVGNIGSLDSLSSDTASFQLSHSGSLGRKRTGSVAGNAVDMSGGMVDIYKSVKVKKIEEAQHQHHNEEARPRLGSNHSITSTATSRSRELSPSSSLSSFISHTNTPSYGHSREGSSDFSRTSSFSHAWVRHLSQHGNSTAAVPQVPPSITCAYDILPSPVLLFVSVSPYQVLYYNPAALSLLSFPSSASLRPLNLKDMMPPQINPLENHKSVLLFPSTSAPPITVEWTASVLPSSLFKSASSSINVILATLTRKKDSVSRPDKSIANDGLPQSRYERDFEDESFIARGGFGSVYKATHKIDRQVYAIKKVALPSFKENSATSVTARVPTKVRNLLREVQTFAQISHHENIVRYYNAWVEDVDGRTMSLDVTNGSESTTETGSEFESETDEDLDFEPETDAEETDEDDDHIEFDDHILFAETDSKLKTANTTTGVEGVHRRRSTGPFHISELLPSSNRRSVSNNDEESDILRLQPIPISNPSSKALFSPTGSKVLSSSPEQDLKYGKSDKRKKLKTPMLYIQMQYPGVTLKQWLKKRNSADTMINLEIIKQLASALSHIHSHSFLHHDLKPENIFIATLTSAPYVHVYLGDFGLSEPLSFPHQATLSPAHANAVGSLPHSASASDIDLRLPSPTPVLGMKSSQTTTALSTSHNPHRRSKSNKSPTECTPTYASPELLNPSELPGRVLTPTSDIYSLGIVMFELYHPFSTGMERAVTLKKLKDDGIIPNHLILTYKEEMGMVMSCLNRDPSRRPNAEAVKAWCIQYQKWILYEQGPSFGGWEQESSYGPTSVHIQPVPARSFTPSPVYSFSSSVRSDSSRFLGSSPGKHNFQVLSPIPSPTPFISSNMNSYIINRPALSSQRERTQTSFHAPSSSYSRAVAAHVKRHRRSRSLPGDTSTADHLELTLTVMDMLRSQTPFQEPISVQSVSASSVVEVPTSPVSEEKVQRLIGKVVRNAIVVNERNYGSNRVIDTSTTATSSNTSSYETRPSLLSAILQQQQQGQSNQANAHLSSLYSPIPRSISYQVQNQNQSLPQTISQSLPKSSMLSHPSVPSISVEGIPKTVQSGFEVVGERDGEV